MSLVLSMEGIGVGVDDDGGFTSSVVIVILADDQCNKSKDEEEGSRMCCNEACRVGRGMNDQVDVLERRCKVRGVEDRNKGTTALLAMNASTHKPVRTVIPHSLCRFL